MGIFSFHLLLNVSRIKNISLHVKFVEKRMIFGGLDEEEVRDVREAKEREEKSDF